MTTKAKKSMTAEAGPQETSGAAPAPLFNSYEEITHVGRENFAALLRANAALNEGLEAIGKEMMGYARISFESAAETVAALLGAKTLDDVVQLNTEFAKTNLEQFIERSTKLSEMGVKVANQALAPLGSRVEATLQKIAKPIAA
jgi:phasin family protein